MEFLDQTIYSAEEENSWQTLSGDDIYDEGETNLFTLTSELSWLREKAEEVERFLQAEIHDQPNSAINPIIICECQSFSFTGEEEVVEMAAADILAEQSHMCSICGKEFRREGNLRLHMRSHREQYNGLPQYKDKVETLTLSKPKSRRSNYSCPFEGCKYNKHHPNFKHLKSVVSLRNHYRRSHCAKMYSCNKCGKEFSFLGDLKTHGNKCGHREWYCSCSLTFSTRNKLLRHVGLQGRQGHKPVSSVPAVTASNGENYTGDDKTPEHSAQEIDSFAVQDSFVLTDSRPCYGGSNEDVLMMGIGDRLKHHTLRLDF